MSVNRRETIARCRLRRAPPHARRTLLQAQFRTRRAAEAFEARERADRSRGTWLDPRRADTTFADVAQEWLASNPAKRPSTRARDECILRVHLAPVLGTRRLGAIAPNGRTDAREGLDRAREAAAPSGGSTASLRAIFAFAVERDYLARSPCRGIKLPEVQQAVSPGRLGQLSSSARRPSSGPITRRWRISARCSGCAGASARDCASGASTSCGPR